MPPAISVSVKQSSHQSPGVHTCDMMIGYNTILVFVSFLHCLGVSNAKTNNEIHTLDRNGGVKKAKQQLVSRTRRESLLSPSANVNNHGSSAQLNDSVFPQTFEDMYTSNDFLECIKEELGDSDGESCYIRFQQTSGDDLKVLNRVIEDCGERFLIRLGDRQSDFYCTCSAKHLECSKSRPRGPRPSRQCTPLSDRILCWLRNFPLIPDCDTTTRSSSTSTLTSTTISPQTSTSRSTESASKSPTSVTSSKTSIHTTSEDLGLSSGSPTQMMSVTESNTRLVGGIVGGVAGGVAITSIIVLICCVCGKSYVVDHTSTTSKPNADVTEDREALCNASSPSPNSRKDHHVYELPDVVGALPPYATCAAVTESEETQNEVEYNHLGDQRKQSIGTGHVYDLLDKTKEKSKQHVINNDYSHAYVQGEVTVDDQSQDVRPIAEQVSRMEDPPYSTIQENSQGGSNPKYFILENQDKPPSSPPYSTITVTDE